MEFEPHPPVLLLPRRSTHMRSSPQECHPTCLTTRPALKVGFFVRTHNFFMHFHERMPGLWQ